MRGGLKGQLKGKSKCMLGSHHVTSARFSVGFFVV